MVVATAADIVVSCLLPVSYDTDSAKLRAYDVNNLNTVEII